MSLVSLGVSALTLGVVHGLNADHLMAIASLAVNGHPDRRRARIIQTATAFACGHALVLGLGAMAAVAFGLLVPAAVSSGAERVGGVLLIAFGALGLWSVWSGRTFSHVHRERDGRTRWHLHIGLGTFGPHGQHAHSRLPAVMGALFAVSSLRALMLLEPFGDQARAMTIPALMLLILLFGLGILMSMSIFGVLLGRLLSLSALQSLGRAAAVIVAVASMALGVYWVVS